MTKRLENMNLPDDIRQMDIDELELLAVELRDFLLTHVSETGGHLASNLGVVELTLALHKVFDTSKDRLIWDVGHQSYIHKILTGRRDIFNTLRQLDGISGFPKRSESIHDAFDTGHSSNSISAAHGMAVARDLKHEDHNVIAVIGDGALTGGEAYEGLNNLGDSKSKAIVILNDNGMSIRANTGGISQHLSKLRVSRKYYAFKGGLKRTVKKVPAIGSGIYYGASKMRDILKYALVDGVFFEELGFTYIGPIDGHNIEALTDNLEAAKHSEKPCVIHIITQKGKGYRNAENDPGVFHGTGPFDKTTGLAIKKPGCRTFSDVFGSKMTHLAAKEPRLTAVSAAMIDGVGLHEFAERYPDRMFDAGIAEQHAVSFAAGLAVSGLKPVVAIYSTFMQRAYDQISQDVCMQNLPVIFAVDRAGVVGADGATHNGIFDLSFLTHMPNMTVLAPRDGSELEQMLEYAVDIDSPVAIRYPRGAAEDIDVPRIPLSEGAQLLKKGDEINIWTCGIMVKTALKASLILESEGIRCGVTDARFITPPDRKKVLEAASSSKLIITCEDNVTHGGFGSIISDIICEEYPGISVYRMGWPSKFIEHGSIPELFSRYRLDAEGMAERIREIIERKA